MTEQPENEMGVADVGEPVGMDIVEEVDPTTDADTDADAEALVDDESPSAPFNDVPNGSEED